MSNTSLDFEFKNENSNRAVLLFHGMTGSPFEMKKYGRALHAAGFDVYCECLAGHGTSEVNIKNVQWQDWYNQSVKKYKELKENYAEVYLSGLCMGAVLALAIAEEYLDVSGIIGLSTTLFLDGWTIPWYNFLLPLGYSSIVKYYYIFPERYPYGLKNDRMRDKISALQKRNTVALDNYPLSCISELLKMSRYTRKNMHKVTAPLLLIHAKEDDLTSTRSADFVFENVSSKNKEYIKLENSYHLIVMDSERDYVFNKAIEFFNSLSAQVKEAQECLN